MTSAILNNLTNDQQEIVHRQEILRRKAYTLWLGMLHHKTTRGKPLDFVNHPELIPIYLDESQKMVIRKSVQCGVSEYMLCFSLGKAEHKLSIFYVLPTSRVRERFVANRLDTLIPRVPYYQEQLKNSLGVSNNLTMKHYGKGTIIFCGSNTPNEFIEFPADVKIIDELDRCHQGNITLADDRMTASDHKISKLAGNPTVSSFGIDRAYKESDQKQYFFKCGSCGRWQTPNWFKHFVREIGEGSYELRHSEHMICEKCERPMSRKSGGVWAALEHGSDISGYHISKIINPIHAVQELFDKFTKALRSETDLQVFYNSDLGIAYTGRGVEITYEMLEGLCDSYWMDSGISGRKLKVPTTCGIDVGTYLHVVIRDLEAPRKARFIGKVSTFDQAKELVEHYNSLSVVVDALPETRQATAFREEVGEHVFLCYYLGNNNNKYNFNDEDGVVKVDRTFSLDAMFGLKGDMAMGKEHLINPKNASTLCDEEYYDQVRSLVRIFNPDLGVYQYHERGPDHFAHAENYCKIAANAPDIGYTGGVY